MIKFITMKHLATLNPGMGTSNEVDLPGNIAGKIREFKSPNESMCDFAI
jgi:hypothetical protein